MKALIKRIRKLLNNRRTRGQLRRVVSIIACIVVFVTTYALVLPAITMESVARCGIEAHEHTAQCYTKVLTCQEPESGSHHHTDDCYRVEKNLICELEEHTHGPGCRDAEGNLTCEKTEHSHSRVCYREEKELVCGLEESDGHHHTDACYTEELVCGKEVHIHSPECYENDETDSFGSAEEFAEAAGSGNGSGFSDAEGPEEGPVFEDPAAAEDGEAVFEEPADAGREFGDSEIIDQYDDTAYTEEIVDGDIPAAEGEAFEDGNGDRAAVEAEAPDGTELVNPSEAGVSAYADGVMDTLSEDPAGQEDEEQIMEDAAAADQAGQGEEEAGTYNIISEAGETEALGQEGLAAEPAEAGETEEAGAAAAPAGAEETEETGAAGDPEKTDAAGAAGSGETEADWAETDAAEADAGLTDQTGTGEEPDSDAAADLVQAPADLERFLTDTTGIWYYPVAFDEDGKADTADMNSESVTEWKKVEGDTVLAPEDFVRIYLAYTLPAGTLSGTNPFARYTLSANLHLTPAQVEAINTHENGYYLGLPADEDKQAEANFEEEDGPAPDSAAAGTQREDYLGVEAVEGTRTPDQPLSDQEEEYISALVKVEEIFNEEGNLISQDLVFTFLPYTVDKNVNVNEDAGESASTDGAESSDEPAREGEAVTGFLTMDFSTGQIDFADTETENIKKAEITFVHENEEKGIGAVRGSLTMDTSADFRKTRETGTDQESEEDPGSGRTKEKTPDGKTDGAEDKSSEGKSSDEKDPEDGSGEGSDKDAVSETGAELPADAMPARTFEDSITLKTARPASVGETGTIAEAAGALSAKSEVRVRVEADEGTFPAGTTMVLSAVESKDMDAVSEAVESAVAANADTESKENSGNAKAPKTCGFQAVDISFRDADGNEIEPAKPVRVVMTSSLIKEASKNDTISAPVVVHVDQEGKGEQVDLVDPEKIETAKGKTEEDLKKEAETASEPQKDTGSEEAAASKTVDPNAAVGFEADQFSIYAIVYTVDFHYEVNGKMYEFSIPGGGFVSFYNLVEVLGIEVNDTNTEKDEIQELVDGVESITFSNSELVSVSKVEEDITVGAIKERLGLECEYSAELTEEEINEINVQAVTAGDWALITILPFDTEETLTVTMENGDEFVVKVTDGQMHTYVISDSGDTYEVIVTYDDTAEIPEDAELRVREIKDTEENYTRNIDASNRELQLQGEPELVHPVQFDIAIVSGGEEVEPKEGSIVNVEIRLAKFLLEEDVSAEENSAAEEEMGMILFNGQEIALDSDALSGCRIAHIAEDGTAEIIEDVESSMTDDKIVMQFETESFSDYLFDGNNGNGLYNLPTTIYVGDEIYMWNQANYWVSNIGSVVTETKANNSDNHKTVTAINTGTFRIYNQNGEYREIRVLPARTGTTPPATIDTINNASIGLTLNLFDYDLNGSLDSYFNGSSHNDNPLSTFAGSGINSGNALKFWGSGIGNNYGSLNQYVEHGVTNIVNNTLTSGYPTLRDNSGGSGNRDLSYLFTPSDGTDKKAYTNVNGLFKKVDDYYVYDSNQNYAWYNPSTNSFDVYNSTYYQHSGSETGGYHNPRKPIGFFPFHPWDDEYDLYVNWNKNLNHHFGMSMSVPFSLPKDPKAVVDTNQEPIVFEFSGDDDLWVFIDGKLAMDIGGVHQPTSGTINFQTGVVTVNGQTQLTANQFNNRFPDLYDGEQHTLQVFYIERGGCDSNCRIQFNMTLYGDIHFDKVDEDDPSDQLAGAVFGIYKDANCTTPLMENLKNGTSRAYVAESDAYGHVQFSDIPLGTYYLKELHAPEGYPLDNTIHTVEVFYDQSTGQVKIKVTIDDQDVEEGVKITNKKPNPITLGLQKEWQNEAGGTIAAPAGTEATFEIKRIRNYETYTEQAIEGQGREVSHLTVGWIHNGETHIHAEYDLIAGSLTTVSWGYKDGYDGTVGYVLNGTQHTKTPVSTNVYSQAFNMPAAGGSATFYVIDNSENGEAIRNINVAGQQFYGNSGGGVIHTFTTHTEPDPDFSYTGDHVTDNQVTLPIDPNTWSYDFTNLPTFERGSVEGVDHPVSFNYSYYLEEVSNTAPAGTTVVYKDRNGNVISSPAEAETSASGTQTITNKVPTGYLRVDKAVTYNGISPVPDGKKSDLAGTYTFNVYTDENCSIPCKVIQGEAPNQQEVNLVLTVTIGDDGAAQSSETVRLPVGDYWIEEQTPNQTGVTPDENRIKVTITADQTTNEPAIASFTNNKEESNNPDELAIELEKTFTGLSSASKIPANYQAALTYTYNGSTVTVPLTGTTQGNVTCTKSADGLTWHWRITQIPKTATNFGVFESNYDITGYTRITKINGSEVQNPGVPQTVSVLVPEITMTNPTSDYTTTDKNKVFTVEDNQILLVRMTNHATVIVSQKSLSYSTRQAIEKMLDDNGGKIPGHDGANAQWVMNFVYFSHEIQGDSFSYGGRTIFFEGNKVKIPHKSSSHEVRVDIAYTSTSAENSFTLENIYTEIPTEVDVLKVEKGNETTIHLPGAVFELRKLEDVAPTTPGGTLTYVKDNDQHVIVSSATTGSNGRLTFSNLTYGVYEIRELTPPPGYIQTEDVTFYLRVDGGVITYVQKGSNKPSEWTDAPNSDGATVYFMGAQEANPDGDPPTEAANATFRVGNTPGAALPNTGGPGTRLFTILGSILVMLAGVMLVKRRRII